MTYPSALSSPNYTSLRASGYKASQYLLLGSNTTVFAARVNQATFTASFAQITFDTVSTGAYTDIGEGMTVLISSTNDRRAAYFVGRVRADNSGVVSTSTVLNVNETSATVADNDYIFVLRDYRLFHELGRYSGDVYYKDYARTFSQLKPVIYGLQSAYAGIVSGSPAGFTVAFSASAIAATSGATISSYAWTIPTGGTVTAGATNTASVTVRFDASATEYWVKLIVTDSGSRTQTRFIPVWAIPADLSTTVSLGFTGASIEGDVESGYSASVGAFAGVSTLLDNTLACILDVEYYNGTQTSLVSAIKFIGRLRTESNQTAPDEQIATSRKVSYEIEGAAAQMSRITTPIITMRDASSPSVWDEIKALTIWRSVVYLLEHSTFHNLYSLSFDSTADTFRAFQLSAPQGNLYQAAQDLLKSINAAIEFAPTGEARAVRDLNFLSSGARSGLTTVANFTSEDWIGFTLERDQVETVGIVEASGGTYYATGGILAAMVTPLLSIAPGVAQGNSEGVGQLASQILTADIAAADAQDELNERAGNAYALQQGNDVLNMDLRGGYNFIMPSRYTYYTFTIASTDNTGGRAYTTSNKWWCKSISIRHDNETGNKEVRAVFQLETSGADAGATGQTVNIPPAGEIPSDLPNIPTFPGYPNFPPLPPVYLPPNPTPGQIPPYGDPGNVPGRIPVDGNAVVITTEDRVFMTKTFLGVPTWYDITPENLTGTIRDMALIGQRIYVLSSNGTDSYVYSAPNAFLTAPVYTTSSAITGTYTILRTTNTLGGVYIQSVSPGGGGGTWTITYDFTVNNGGWANVGGRYTNTAYSGGAWNSGQDTNPPPFADDMILGIGIDLPSDATVTSARVIYSGATAPVNQVNQFEIRDAGTAIATAFPFTGGTGGDYTVTVSPAILADRVELYIGRDGGGVLPAAFQCTLIELQGTGTSPYAGVVVTAFSDDFAATFSAPITVDTVAITDVGIDTIKVGAAIIAGRTGQVEIATAAGSSYSNYGIALPTDAVPTCLVIPYYQFASTTVKNTSTSTPQYLIASNTPSSGGETVWKVTASGATQTAVTPTVSGNDGLAISHRSVDISWWSGSYFAAVLDFGGTPRLVVSTNAGAAWTDRGVLDDDARMVCYRKGDRLKKQLFIANGGPAYSYNHGSSIATKSYPADSATEPVLVIQVYG